LISHFYDNSNKAQVFHSKLFFQLLHCGS
jgi:hypothetical protein